MAGQRNDSRSLFTADGCSVTASASASLSKTLTMSGSELSNLVLGLVDEVDTSLRTLQRLKKVLNG